MVIQAVGIGSALVVSAFAPIARFNIPTSFDNLVVWLQIRSFASDSVARLISIYLSLISKILEMLDKTFSSNLCNKRKSSLFYTWRDMARFLHEL